MSIKVTRHIDPELAKNFQEVFGRDFWRKARFLDPKPSLLKVCRGCKKPFRGDYLGPTQTHCEECRCAG
jgi:hypothetical protein